MAGKYEKFGCLKTAIGNLGTWNKKEDDKNEFVEELGPGIAIYFKIMRVLGLLLVIFTILHIPLYTIYSKSQG